MDHYERLERIDYKSARDVVTEADHLSRGAHRRRHPGALPGRRDHRRGDRRAPRRGGRGADLRPRPGLDRRPARRHRELRQRHPVLLRLDRPRRRRPAGRRGHPRSDPERDLRRHGRRAGDARSAESRSHASDKEQLTDFVISMALSGRAVASRARNVRKAIRISRSMGSAALALAYVANGRFDAFVQQGGLSPGTSPRPGSSPSAAGRRSRPWTAGRGSTWPARPESVGVLAAPPPHHAGRCSSSPPRLRVARSVQPAMGP